MNEHERDIKLGNLNNALCLHSSKTDRNFDFNEAIMLVHIHNKSFRQIFEVGAILLLPSVNKQLDFSIYPLF